MSLSRGAIISSSSKANTPRPGSGAREAQGSGGKDEDENEEVRADLYGACRPVASYQKLNQIGEGTYGYVYRAVERSTGTMVALKKVILHNEKQDGFPLTSLREIRMLKKVSQHPNCVKLLDMAVGRKRDGVFLVFEYCQHDLANLIDSMGSHRFTMSEVKSLVTQLLSGVEHLHEQWVVHRDLKMSNLLYTDTGLLKLADFGLARLYGAPPKPMTPKVVTLWYRAPELLLGCELYDTAIDMWAVGCIFGELLAFKPILQGKDEPEQLHKIFELLGAPNERIWPGVTALPHVAAGRVSLRPDKYPYNNLPARFPQLSTPSPRGLDLLTSLLAYDPAKRITAREALRHDFFSEKPAAKAPQMMPTFPTQHDEMGRQEADMLERQRRAAQQQQGGTAMLLREDLFSSGGGGSRLSGGGMAAAAGRKSGGGGGALLSAHKRLKQGGH